MQNIAEFRIIGRIGSTEIKEKVATLDVAANYGRKVGNDWEDDTHWNRVTFFGKNIERAAKMAKGDLVHVTGRVRQSRYDRDGHAAITAVDLRVVKRRFGDRAFEIIRHQQAPYPANMREHPDMRADPVRQRLAPGHFGIGVVRRAKHADEDLGHADLTRQRIVDTQSLA